MILSMVHIGCLYCVDVNNKKIDFILSNIRIE